MGISDRHVADIAVALPGATEVFRAYGIDYCCGGAVPLGQAAAARGADLAEIELRLARLREAVLGRGEPAPAALPTDALIDHLLSRYHEVHRRELPELARLAARVEARHAGHPRAPVGLHAALVELESALEEHMQKEEQILFPLMRGGGHPMISAPIGHMRFEHDEHGARLARLEALSHGLTVPEDACTSWRALGAGLRKLVDDIHEHVHLENNALFPRFGA